MGERIFSDSLAWERDDHDGLAGENSNGDGGGSDLDMDSKRDNSYVIEPEEIGHRQNSTSASSMARSEEAVEENANGLDDTKIFSPNKTAHENAFMESWKANFEADIKARDEKEAAKRAEWETTAKKELETWYAHYRKQMALRSADNRTDAPRDASGKAYDGFSGTAPTVRDTAVWENVCGMCDLTSKNTRSTHDLSRMRGLLLNLKTPSSH
nr:clathrin light chain [Hymenolepis microstoma]